MKSPHSSADPELEIRTTGSASVDLADDAVIRGYAIRFNTLSGNLGGFRERIVPEAVDRSLKGDVRALVDHDTAKILGRTKAGTLSMRKDTKGLKVEIEPDPEISYARDILRSVSRGDVSGMSFGFRVLDDAWDEDEESGMPIRTILDMTIAEVSIVTFPAYAETSAEVAKRSLNLFLAKKKGASDWRAKYHEIQTIAGI
jgi:HK97 family phage prohead protease